MRKFDASMKIISTVALQPAHRTAILNAVPGADLADRQCRTVEEVRRARQWRMRRDAHISRSQRHRDSRARPQMDSASQRRRRPRFRRPSQRHQDSNRDRERNSCDADRGVHARIDARVRASDSSRDSSAGASRVDAIGRFHVGCRRYPRADAWHHRLRIDWQGNGAARGRIRNESDRAQAQPVGDASIPDGVRRALAIPKATFRRATSVPTSAKRSFANPTTYPSRFR